MGNQKIIDVLIVVITVMIFTPFIQGGCSGGGGSSSPAAGTTRTLASVSASSATDSLELLESVSSIEQGISDGSDEAAGALSTGPVQPTIFSKIRGIMDKVADETQIGGVHALGSLPASPPTPCADNGTESVSMTWDGPDNPLDCTQMSNVSMTLTMDQCSELGETMDGTMKVTLPGSSCTLLAGDPTNMTMVMDMTIDDGVSILDFNKLTMKVSNLVYDQNGEITDMTVLLDGTVTEDQESVSFGDFYIDWTFDSVNTQYLTSMDGYIECPCVNGWLQITTQEDIVLPLGAACPVGGLYTITGSDGEATISINADTSVDIIMDGAVIQSYPSCTVNHDCLG
jgi:hypothetical protein